MNSDIAMGVNHPEKDRHLLPASPICFSGCVKDNEVNISCEKAKLICLPSYIIWFFFLKCLFISKQETYFQFFLTGAYGDCLEQSFKGKNETFSKVKQASHTRYRQDNAISHQNKIKMKMKQIHQLGACYQWLYMES